MPTLVGGSQPALYQCRDVREPRKTGILILPINARRRLASMPEPNSEDALVVTTFGRRMDIRLHNGKRRSARVKGRQLRPVCGDHVAAEPIDNEPDWLITRIHARDNELTRPDSRGRKEVLAANLSLLVCVVADPPKPDWYIVDRYLSAAELMNIGSAVLFNKTDIAQPDAAGTSALAEYSKIGYPVLHCSAVNGSGLDQLQQLLNNEVAILVGQSGVGKSSLINRIAEDPMLRTGAVSSKSGEGRHTTVNSAMLHLPDGGAVIDSPGVRDYAPSIAAVDQIVHGFREIADAGNRCRYANCRHLREPACAVKQAAEDQLISPRRYESYKRLVNLTEKLNPQR